MDDQAGNQRDAKEHVVRIIGVWIERTGLKRQSLAALAGFPEYNLFYKAYLDLKRPLSTDPERALGVVRAVAAGLPRERRAAAREVVSFLAQTRFPLDRLAEVLPLLDPHEWDEVRGLVPGSADGLPPAAGPGAGDAVHGRLARIEAMLQRLRGEPAAEAVLAAAIDRLAAISDGLPEPQALPLPHRMPLIRGRLFTGREAELRQLIGLLREQRPGEIVAITGMGGVGKTSLTSELVHRYGQFFAGGVFWVSCAQPQTIPWEVAACGEGGLVARDDWADLPVEERARLVTLAWQEPLPRLLVFDECEDDATLRRWRPTSGGCRVVLTSRRARWSRGLGVTTLALGELAEDASVALLRGYRPDLAAGDPALAAIAHEVGGLPLALHLAGSYLETYQDDPAFGDPARFLGDLRAIGPLGHAALGGVDVSMSPTDHELSVGRTFALSLERLAPGATRDGLARALLARAAHLAPGEPFGPDLLAAAAGAGEEVRQAVRRLADLGLLSEGRDGLRVHRLVAAFARAALADAAAPGAVRRALIAQTAQVYGRRDAVAARVLLPHLSLHANEEPPEAPEEAVALWNAVPFLRELGGDLAGGLAYLERAHAALLRAEAIETPLGAEVLNNLAEWQRAMGDAAAARPLHEQALAIRRAVLPPDDPALGESHLNLGETLREAGLLDEAQEAYERALAIGLRGGGPTHEITLAARNQLALLLYTRERYAEARGQFEALIAANGAAFGADDPRTATVRNNLASALARLGEHKQAHAEFAVVVAHLAARYGDEHPETLRARLNGARALVLGGDHAQGARELRLLVAPLTAAYGAEHPLARTARATLAEAEEGL